MRGFQAVAFSAADSNDSTGVPSVHIPVMCDEVVAALAPAAGEIYVDGTFGAGGYTRAVLAAAPGCTVIAIDRDPQAQARAQDMAAAYEGRLIPVAGCFGDAEALVQGAGFEKVDGFMLDLGVSSPQIDEAERGFSFRFDGPLDMRMDPSRAGTAADIVNGYAESDLADIIYQFGGERHSRRVARAIVERRAQELFARTLDLAGVIRRVVPRAADGIDPATRTFQALRIAVNREMEELAQGLVAAERLLTSGGRLVVVTFHSLEDGMVKKFMHERSGRQSSPSRHAPVTVSEARVPTFILPSAKAVQPSDDECAVNPRARSAKMRVAVRTDAPAREEGA